MSNLILPQKWTSQPQYPVQIDWGNPLTRGLCLGNTASLFNNAVNGAPPTRKTISVSKKAETVYSHANGEIVFSAPGIRAFVGRYLFDPTNARFGGMFSSTNRSGIYFEYTSSQLKAVVFNNGAWSTTNIGSTPATGALITLAVVSDSDTSHRVYRDGVLVATLTNTAQVSTFNVAGAMYCDASAFYTAAVKDVVGFAGFTSTPSNTEIKSLSDNPWQIFKPQARRIFVASAGGTVWNVSVSESITLADTLSSIAAFQSAQAESIALVDSQSVTNLAVASLYEAMTLSDTPSAGKVTGASISEAMALAESLSASALFSASMTEALSLVEAVTSLLIAAASVAESVILSDTPSAVAALSASTAESVTLADTSSTSGQVTSATITESIALTDAGTALANLAVSIVESVSLADSLIAAAQFTASMSEALSLVDSSSTSGQVLAAAIAESLAMTDAWSATASLTASVIEALSLVDLTQAIAQMGVVQVEAMALADSTTGNAVYTVAISELVTLADVVDWVAEIINTDKYPLAGVPIIRPLYGVSIQYPLAAIKRTYP